MKRIEFLHCLMHAGTMQETVDAIVSRIELRQFTQHVVINVAKLVNMQKDMRLAESIQSCDIINIDGTGIVWGARFMGLSVPERVAGIDLFERLIALSSEKEYPIFLLGASEKIVEITCSRLTDKFPKLIIVGYHHGYFWDNEESVVMRIRESGARLLFVAISSPKKEIFIDRWRKQLGVDFVMGVGGTFDVIAGKTKRAPHWMQRLGLEWFFRVLQEPRRLGGRYFVTNSVFAWMMLRARFLALILPHKD